MLWVSSVESTRRSQPFRFSFLLSIPTMSTFTQLFQRHCGGTRFQEHIGDKSLSCSKKMGKHLVHFAFIGLHPAVALTNYIPLLRILLLMRVSAKCQQPKLSVTKPTPCLLSSQSSQNGHVGESNGRMSGMTIPPLLVSS